VRALNKERIVCRESTLSVLTDCAEPHAADQARPVLTLLHGMFRSSQVFVDLLAPYRDWADVLIPDLPGMGESEAPLRDGLNAISDEVARLIERRIPGRQLILLGESAGGIIALSCCAGRLPVTALILLDPPLSMSKQWVIQRNCLGVSARGHSWFARTLANVLAGVNCDSGELQERIYYHLFEHLAVPCLILTGDIPLMPVRAVKGVPNCFDAVDAFIVRSLAPDCRIANLANCGHLVYADGGQRCHDLIHGFVAGLY